MIPLINLLLLILGPAFAQNPPDASRFARPPSGATSIDQHLAVSIVGASIRGVVVNSQGTAVSGASVVTKDLKTGVETRTRTDDKGSFIFSGLAAGAYSITTAAPGLLQDERKLDVSTGISPPLRIELKDGALRTLMPSLKLPAVPPGTAPDQVLRELRKPPAKPIDTQIDNQLEAAKNGQIVFNPPSQMQAGKDETVTVRVSKSLVENLTAGLLGSGQPQSQPIKVGSEMGVTLKGPADYFTVSLMNSSEKQAVTANEATEWLFDVLPLKAGTANLILTAYVVLDTPDGAEQHDYPVFAREIEITTAPKPFLSALPEFVANNWDKLVGVLVSTGLLGWIIARLKRRSSSKDKTSGRENTSERQP